MINKTANWMLFMGLTFLISSCGGGEQQKEESTEQVPVEKSESCIYTYNNDSTHVYWTSYKHSAKVPVNGQFDNFTAEGSVSGSSVEDAIKNISLAVDVSSINSNDTLRDRRVLQSFFQKMANTASITGTIKSVENGSGRMTFKMNNVEQEVGFTYTVSDSKVELKASINATDFNAQDAMASLNKACEEKHTGGDGVNKLWPDVGIYITTVLTKGCK